MEKRDSLPITKPLLIIAAISLVIGILSVVLTIVSDLRADLIREKYTLETQQYIAQNREGLNTLFSSVFYEGTCIQTDNNTGYSGCELVSQQEIMNLISDDLKDFSSLSFIRLNSDGAIVTMTLSGDTNLYYHNDSEQYILLTELLQGKRNEVPWRNYYVNRNNFNIKEVVVPVKDDRGMTIGAIVLGVIE